MAMKRCVAKRSWGEIFTLISESESLNKEKSCRFLSRWGTRCFFRLSAYGDYRGQKTAMSESLLVFGGLLKVTQDREILWDHTHISAAPSMGPHLFPREWKGAAERWRWLSWSKLEDGSYHLNVLHTSVVTMELSSSRC